MIGSFRFCFLIELENVLLIFHWNILWTTSVKFGSGVVCSLYGLWLFVFIFMFCSVRCRTVTLRKHAYSNILKISPPKNWKFSDKKNSEFFFHIFCSKHRLWVLVRTASARRGGSNEYPQSMFLSRNKKNGVYPCKPVLLYKSGV